MSREKFCEFSKNHHKKLEEKKKRQLRQPTQSQEACGNRILKLSTKDLQI